MLNRFAFCVGRREPVRWRLALLGLRGVGARPLAVTPAATAETDVDVELVLAVDASYSMDPDECSLQQEGYVTALKSRGLHTDLYQWAASPIKRFGPRSLCISLSPHTRAAAARARGIHRTKQPTISTCAA